MGLDVSHGCWRGAYSAFMRWRRMLAKVAGLPPLDLMEGFYHPDDVVRDPFYTIGRDTMENPTTRDIKQSLPISWDCIDSRFDALKVLLSHSDCDGEIKHNYCAPLACSLEGLMGDIPTGSGGGHIRDWRDMTQQFIDGLRCAAERAENVTFA